VSVCLVEKGVCVQYGIVWFWLNWFWTNQHFQFTLWSMEEFYGEPFSLQAHNSQAHRSNKEGGEGCLHIDFRGDSVTRFTVWLLS